MYQYYRRVEFWCTEKRPLLGGYSYCVFYSEYPLLVLPVLLLWAGESSSQKLTESYIPPIVYIHVLLLYTSVVLLFTLNYYTAILLLSINNTFKETSTGRTMLFVTMAVFGNMVL